MQKMYTIIAKKGGETEWQVDPQPKNAAIAQAMKEAKNSPDLQIFVVTGDAWLNANGNHEITGKAW